VAIFLGALRLAQASPVIPALSSWPSVLSHSDPEFTCSKADSQAFVCSLTFLYHATSWGSEVGKTDTVPALVGRGGHEKYRLHTHAMACVCTPALRWKFSPHCELLRGWKLNLTMVFGGGTFRKYLRLKNGDYDFLRGERKT
jgi:hypothetical protein